MLRTKKFGVGTLFFKKDLTITDATRISYHQLKQLWKREYIYNCKDTSFVIFFGRCLRTNGVIRRRFLVCSSMINYMAKKSILARLGKRCEKCCSFWKRRLFTRLLKVPPGKPCGAWGMTEQGIPHRQGDLGKGKQEENVAFVWNLSFWQRNAISLGSCLKTGQHANFVIIRKIKNWYTYVGYCKMMILCTLWSNNFIIRIKIIIGKKKIKQYLEYGIKNYTFYGQ